MESGETIEVVEGGLGVGVVSLQPLLSSLLLLHLNIRKTPAGLRAGHTSMYVCLSMCVCVCVFYLPEHKNSDAHIHKCRGEDGGGGVFGQQTQSITLIKYRW